MKKLLLVEVPDNLKIKVIGIDNAVPANHIPLNFKEITLPTDKEIDDTSFSKVRQDYEEAFIEGAKWMRDNIM